MNRFNLLIAFCIATIMYFIDIIITMIAFQL